MLIGKDYKIESDEDNVTVFKRKVAGKKSKNEGGVLWQPIAYYNTLHGAVEGVATMEINKSGMKDIRAISAKIDELYKWIREAI